MYLISLCEITKVYESGDEFCDGMILKTCSIRIASQSAHQQPPEGTEVKPVAAFKEFLNSNFHRMIEGSMSLCKSFEDKEAAHHTRLVKKRRHH